MKTTALFVLLSSLGLAVPAFSEVASNSLMKKSIPAGHRYVTLAPEGRDFLHSRVLLPEDFKVSELPPEEIDFSKGTSFMPLCIAVTAYGPLVFAASARPAYEDGAVTQWLDYLCREEGYQAGAPSIVKIGVLKGVSVDAIQQGDGIKMHMRLVLIENGGRLFQMTAMAPEELWPSAVEKLEKILASFEPAEIQEPRAALVPGMPLQVITQTTEPKEEAAAPAAPVAPVTAAEAEEKSEQPAAPTARLTDAEFAELVLAADASSLDPEQKINANLRDRGVGLVPRVLNLDAKKKAARLGAGAIEAIITVPYGWHVIDDGKRTLVFDAKGRVQVNLSIRPRNGESLTDLAQSYTEEYTAKQPELEMVTVELDGITGVGMRGLKIDGEILDQTFLLRELPGKDRVLVARATGKSEDVRQAMNLAGDILVRMELPSDTIAVR